MSALHNQKLPRAVKTLLDIIYGLLVGICVFLILWVVFSPLLMRVSDISISASVPVGIGSGVAPQFDVDIAGSAANEVHAAFVDKGQGTLRLETTDWWLIFVSNLAKLLTAIGLAYIFYLLRAVLQAIIRREPFTAENTSRIRRMGNMVLLVGFLRPAVEYIAANEVLNRLMIVDPALSLPSTFKADVILFSLLILILAQVWSYGLELERDQALTV